MTSRSPVRVVFLDLGDALCDTIGTGDVTTRHL